MAGLKLTATTGEQVMAKLQVVSIVISAFLLLFRFFFSSFLSSFKYYFLFESHDLGRNCAVRSIRNQQKKTFSFLYYSGRARVPAKASLFDRAVAQYFR